MFQNLHQRGERRGRACGVEWQYFIFVFVFFFFLKSQLLLTRDEGITCPEQKTPFLVFTFIVGVVKELLFTTFLFSTARQLCSDKFLFLLKVQIQVLVRRIC